ncbi:MAG: hypothetical protein SCALA702_11590 [Melioribacteraceae bacterium]|nr:MAG: hypothetical protein SCALA702_11590 [Melioribacteraceae bacterium]
MNRTGKRIIFLDIMRAIAVLMMVQGHTTDTFLGDEYRTADSVFYQIWLTFRGFTAPIFMFTSGTVFTYLFQKNKLPFAENPRVKKGFIRFLTLVGIGYLLRYPTYKIFDFSNVGPNQWRIFFGVDALHLIGFGLLFVIITLYLAEKIKMNPDFLFVIGVVFFFGLTGYIRSFDWSELVPLPVAGYLYRGSGSIFPLFPWVGYVLAGGLLGHYLAEKPGVQRTDKFAKRITGSGIILIIASIGYYFVHSSLAEGISFWNMGIPLMLFRLGIVITLNGVVAYISMNLETIPPLIIQIGKNTLLIYVVHLVILYGSAWNPGFYNSFAHTFSFAATAGVVTIMLTLMILMVIIKEKFIFIKRKSLK